MNSKKFYFVGCSTTWENLDIPKLISAHHSAEFVNDAVSGGTNQRTVSRVLQNIRKYDHMYIQWGPTERFTLHDPKNWHEIHFSSQLSSTYKNLDYYLTFGKYYYTYWSSILFEHKKFLEQIILTQAILAQNSQSYLMWGYSPTMWGHPTRQIDLTCSDPQFIEQLGNLIDITNFDDVQILQQYHELQNLYFQIDFEYYMKASTVNFNLVNSTGHLNTEGQKFVVDRILSFENNQKHILKDNTYEN